jgi:hypothetical protein
MRFVWKNNPAAPPIGSAESAEKATRTGAARNFDDYVKAFENLGEAEKQQALKRTQDLDSQFTPHAVQAIRKAGLSAEEVDQDPDKSCIHLSSLYLKRVPGSNNKFKADFKGNYLAEFKAVGWGHCFSLTVEEIKVYNQLGEVICDRAIRDVDPETGKEGYFAAAGLAANPPRHDYVFMYGGFVAEVLKTISPAEAEMKRKNFRERTMTFQRQQRERKTFGMMGPGGVSGEAIIDQNLQSLGDRTRRETDPLESADTRQQRERTVAIARKYAGSRYFDKDYQDPRNADLKGGKLGCAWVASTILVEAGYLNAQIKSVEGCRQALLAKGWTVSREKPEPGDVVIWEALPGRYAQNAAGDSQWMPGFKHIGIVTGPNTVVDNKSNQNPPGPREDALYRPGRGIEATLKPPDAATARPDVTAGAPAQRPAGKPTGAPSVAPSGRPARGQQQKPKETQEGASLAARINNETAPWMDLIRQSCKRHNVPVEIVQAIMHNESGGKPNARGVNTNGSIDQGLMQLNNAYFKDPNIMDPAVNIETAVKHIRGLMDRYGGDLVKVAEAYNCGHAKGEVLRNGRVLSIPPMTEKYRDRAVTALNALNPQWQTQNREGTAMA